MNGSKYDESLDITEIAKRVRADIKAEIAAGRLPAGLKIGARVSRYSGGQSLTVKITAMPGPICNPAFVKWLTDNPHEMWSSGPKQYTPAAAAAFATIERVVAAYNYDNSRSEIDYFDVNFYAHINYAGELLAKDRAATAAGNAFPDLCAPEEQPDNVIPIARATKLRSGS